MLRGIKNWIFYCMSFNNFTVLVNTFMRQEGEVDNFPLQRTSTDKSLLRSDCGHCLTLDCFENKAHSDIWHFEAGVWISFDIVKSQLK